jgi:hypothetical protein
MKEKIKFKREKEMKALRLTLGLVFIFLLFNTLCFAQDPFSIKQDYKVMPLSPSSGIFTTAQEAVQNLPLEVGKTKVELDRQDVNLLSQEENKTILEFVDTKEKIQLTYNENSIVIEYGGTTLTIDSNVAIGKVVVDETGVKVYDKDNNIIALINKDGSGQAKIGDMYVNFDKGTKVTLKGSGVDMAYDVNGDGKVDMADVEAFRGKLGTKAGDANWDPKFDLNKDGAVNILDVLTYKKVFNNEGKIGTIEVETEAGSYKVERLGLIMCADPGGCNPVGFKLVITTPGGDTFYFDPKDVGAKSLEVKDNGSATLTIGFPNSRGNQIISVDFDNSGKATTLFLNDSNGQDHKISLGRDGACMWGQCKPVNLSFRVNDDSSVTIESDVGNAVRLNFTADGNVEAIKPDGAVVPIEGDIKGVTFHDNGQLSISFNDGTSIVINPGEDPNDGGWWDGMTVDQIIAALKDNLSEAGGKLTELAKADLALAADVWEAMDPQDAVPIIKAMLKNQGAQTVADIMKVMDPAKVAAIMAVSAPNRWYSKIGPRGVDYYRNRFLPTTGGLTVNECADILKSMGGLGTKEVQSILSSLFKLSPWKTIQIRWISGGYQKPGKGSKI